MMFSKATEKCLPVAENCWQHFQKDMFQFFSVQLSKTLISTGPIQLYGYIAARDLRDGMLNYVVNYSRDDPVIVQQVHFYTCLKLLYVKLVLFAMQAQYYHSHRRNEIECYFLLCLFTTTQSP